MPAMVARVPRTIPGHMSPWNAFALPNSVSNSPIRITKNAGSYPGEDASGFGEAAIGPADFCSGPPGKGMTVAGSSCRLPILAGPAIGAVAMRAIGEALPQGFYPHVSIRTMPDGK